MTANLPHAAQAVAVVLIADDEPSTRLLVQTTIESDDYQVVEAGDGDEAWAMIKRHKPSLVILDIQMPGKNGLEVLGLIRSDPALKATRVIVLTAKALADDVAAGLTTGADFYLIKPFSPLDLLARVDEALRL